MNELMNAEGFSIRRISPIGFYFFNFFYFQKCKYQKLQEIYSLQKPTFYKVSSTFIYGRKIKETLTVNKKAVII